MMATLLAHTGHVAAHRGAEAFAGVALLLIGAATVLWRTRQRNSPYAIDRARRFQPGWVLRPARWSRRSRPPR